MSTNLGAIQYNCLSSIDEARAKTDLDFIISHYDDLIFEALEHQKAVLNFEQDWIINNGGGLEYMAVDRREIEAHLAMLDRDDQVGSYIDEALAMDEDDLDHDEDFTAAAVCRP